MLDLPALRWLDLSGNSLSGPLPGGALAKLVRLEVGTDASSPRRPRSVPRAAPSNGRVGVWGGGGGLCEHRAHRPLREPCVFARKRCCSEPPPFPDSQMGFSWVPVLGASGADGCVVGYLVVSACGAQVLNLSQNRLDGCLPRAPSAEAAAAGEVFGDHEVKS